MKSKSELRRIIKQRDADLKAKGGLDEVIFRMVYDAGLNGMTFGEIADQLFPELDPDEREAVSEMLEKSYERRLRIDGEKAVSGQMRFWIVREGEDARKIAPEVADVIAQELSEPLDNRVCPFCSNKAASAAVIAHCWPGETIYTASLCAGCASGMSNEQMIEKIQRGAEKRSAEMLAIWQALKDDGTVVATGEMRPDPKTGEPQPVYTLKKNPDATSQDIIEFLEKI